MIVCIHVPVLDRSAAEKKSAKSRWRIAASAPPPSLLTVRIYPRAGRTHVRYHGHVVTGQRSLFAAGDPAVDADAQWERIDLGAGSWIDVARTYMLGTDTLLDDLLARVP